MDVEAVPKSETNHCQHFVKRKKRYCRMTIKKGNKFCGEHEPTIDSSVDGKIATIGAPIDATNTTDDRIRVTCPLDPTHSCFASKLAKHLKVCNAKITSYPAFIQKGINLGYNPLTHSDEDRLELSVIDTNEVLTVIDKINKLYDETIGNTIKDSNHRHILLNDECNVETYGPNKKRHLIQTSALAGQLQNEDFLVPKTCFIEFGGGKGQMTYWLAKISEDISDTDIVLVDKASHRHKQDNKLENMRHRVHRIRADISDLLLEELECVTKSENVIGIGKHLCGAATDLAFRCMTRYEKCETSGIVLAFCCHHRCTWMTYTGKTYLESMGFSKKDFDIMCGVSSWATCGSGYSRDRKLIESKVENDVHENEHRTEGESLNNDLKRNRFGFTLQERESTGRRTKHILDYGRMCYLKDNGYSCEFKYYVPEHMTPENLCIIARRVKSK